MARAQHDFPGSGQRGFTLFTALVAFILIVLAMLLVQSMISTERNVSDTISDISEQEDMQAIADLSRADALQVFNFGIRYSIETFSTEDRAPKDGLPDNPFPMFTGTSSRWIDLESEFVKDRFSVSPSGTQQQNKFATITAKHLISILERSDDSRGYRIDLAKPDEARMTSVLEKTFNKSADASDFFEVIRCDPGGVSSASSDFYKNCIGSFYVTLDLSRGSIDDQQYETFPQIRVENQLTHRVLKEPIMPRGKVRIYVPVRLFKALAGAWVLAKGGGNGIFDSGFDDGIRKSGAGTQNAAEDFLEKKIGETIRGKSMGSYNCGIGSNECDVTGGLIKEGSANGSDYGFELYKYAVQASAPQDQDGVERLGQYTVTFYFRDTNPEYLVSSSSGNIYAIRLYKTLIT